jgi:hypothetical protein
VACVMIWRSGESAFIQMSASSLTASRSHSTRNDGGSQILDHSIGGICLGSDQAARRPLLRTHIPNPASNAAAAMTREEGSGTEAMLTVRLSASAPEPQVQV